MTVVRNFDLYSNGYIEEFSDGTRYLERDDIVYEGNESDRIHTVQGGDTITGIAYKCYNRILSNPQQYWWIIADANDIVLPLDLTEYVGSDIVIPDPVIFELNV